MTSTARLLKRLALFNQGLSKQAFGKGLAGTKQAIEHLGYVQIDTISVVERAHHHILWSRVPDYDLTHLNRLVKQKHIFEYWYHAASYLPMQDYRYALRFMNTVRQGDHPYFSRGDKAQMREILARVKAEGKIRLRDIDKGNKQNPGTWWNVGPSRRAIEQLFMQGDLMICERQGMEKFYDLTERCLPDDIILNTPSLEEYAQYLFNTTLRAHGVFTWKQLIHLKTGKDIRNAMTKVLETQREAKLVKALKLDDGQIVYMAPDALEQALSIKPQVKILSPFDNVLIHRERLSAIFDFDYRIECYVPKAKRVFGYFCLPILYGDTFVGQVDCKAHRSQQRLEIVKLHLIDNRIKNHETFLRALNLEVQGFAQFNNCSAVDAI